MIRSATYQVDDFSLSMLADNARLSSYSAMADALVPCVSPRGESGNISMMP